MSADALTGVRPLLRYELRAALGLRSTHVLVGLGLLTALATAVATTSVWAGPGVRMRLPVETVVYAPMGALAVVLQVLGALRTGIEHRHRHGLLVHVHVPRRGWTYAVRTAATVLQSGALTLVVLTLGLGLLALDGESAAALADEDLGTWVGLAGRALLVAGFYGVSGLAVAALTRSLLGGMAIPLAFSSIVEPALVLVLADRASWLPQVLPFSAARHVLGLGTGSAAEPPVQVLVVVAWAAVLVAAGAYRHLRSDL